MKLATFLSLLLTCSAFAGPVDYSKEDKNPVAPPPPPASCFGPGFDLGIFGGGYLPTNRNYRDNGLGGGALAEYFFNDYIGIQASYGAFGPAPVHNEFGGDLVLRYPIQACCVAPYVLLGGGGISDSQNFGFFDVGGGIEVRCAAMPHIGVFADGTYHFASQSYRDFTLVRIGVKYAF